MSISRQLWLQATWGPALGPVITGFVYDRYQSYAPLLSADIPISLIAGFFYASLRPPKMS